MKPTYEELRKRGIAEMDRGDYGAALDAFRGALSQAEESEEMASIHAARCNVSLVLLELQEYRSAEKGLREILLQSRDDRVAAVAALILAQSLAKQYETERALEYLKISLDRARRAGARKVEAESLNLRANIAVLSGDYPGAGLQYEEALKIYRELGEEGSFVYQLILENRGYALLLEGDNSRAISLMAESLRNAERNGQHRVIAVASQDLGYAMLLSNRIKRAETYASRALSEAMKHRYSDVVKNSLFLLMEISLRQEDEAKFDHFFDRLQVMFPEIKLSRSFFKMFDISDIITLKEI